MEVHHGHMLIILAARRICRLLSMAAVYAEALTIRLRQILSASGKYQA